MTYLMRRDWIHPEELKFHVTWCAYLKQKTAVSTKRKITFLSLMGVGRWEVHLKESLCFVCVCVCVCVSSEIPDRMTVNAKYVTKVTLDARKKKQHIFNFLQSGTTQQKRELVRWGATLAPHTLGLWDDATVTHLLCLTFDKTLFVQCKTTTMKPCNSVWLPCLGNHLI